MDEQANMDGGGADDLYSDGPAKESAEDKAPDDDKGENPDDTVEAVLPKSILAGKEFNVGDEVVLKITAMHDDQISVAYAPAKGGKDESGGEEAGEMPEAKPESESGGPYD